MAYQFHFATLTVLGAKMAKRLSGTLANETAYEVALAHLDLAVATAIAAEKTKEQFLTDLEMLLKARREKSGPDFKRVN